MTELSQVSKVRGGIHDLLSLGEFEPEEFVELLDLADAFRAERDSGHLVSRIPSASLALLFEKPSTRTRVSFEVAMFELGGHAVVLNTKEMQTSRGESPEDTAMVLSQYCCGIAARVMTHDTLTRFANAAPIPVINALSDLYHPCQTVADIQTIRQFKQDLTRVKIAWAGDGNNVCNSFVIGASLCGASMSIACPTGYAPLREALEVAEKKSSLTHSRIEIVEDPKEAVQNADVVATDTFVSMGQEEEKSKRLNDFLPRYQVNDDLMSYAKGDAIFMHCLPAHRGEEVTPSVIDGPRSVIWQEAQNRLHSQKAILYTLLRRFNKRKRPIRD